MTLAREGLATMPEAERRMRAPWRQGPLWGAAMLVAASGLAEAQAPDPAATPSRAVYATACASCHGAEGRGNPLIDAPVLAGLSAAYLARQLDGFQLGYRGLHPDDREGAEMRPMVAGLDDTDLTALGEWLSALPPPDSLERPGLDGVEAPTDAQAPSGDPGRGQRLYADCAVCHGPAGLGNDALGAPRLAGQAAWYTARQLRKFIAGVRGAHPDDRPGASMRAAVAAFDPRDVDDLVAWLETLREQ